MKSKGYLLTPAIAMVLLTGFLTYIYGIEVNPADWHSRSLYVDNLRPYLKPLFAASLVMLLFTLWLSRSMGAGSEEAGAFD